MFRERGEAADNEWKGAKMRLDDMDRIVLINQMLILKAVDPQRSGDYETKLNAVQSGYEHEFQRLWSLGPIFSTQDCAEVIDILNLFRMLGDSYDDLKAEAKGGIDDRRLRFPGFDGNGEAEQFGYASYLIKELGLFQEALRDDLNSHYPTLPRCRAMLEEWKRRGEPYTAMSQQDIAAIIEAGESRSEKQ